MKYGLNLILRRKKNILSPQKAFIIILKNVSYFYSFFLFFFKLVTLKIIYNEENEIFLIIARLKNTKIALKYKKRIFMRFQSVIYQFYYILFYFYFFLN